MVFTPVRIVRQQQNTACACAQQAAIRVMAIMILSMEMNTWVKTPAT